MARDIQTKPVFPSLQDALMGLFGTSKGEGASLITLPGGSRLFSEGDESDHLYLLRSGRLGVFRHAEGSSEPSLIGIVKPGEPVGEMSLISGTPHSATVIALRDSDLLAMPREDFLLAVDAHPELMLALSRTIVTRTRQQAPSNTPNVFAFFALCEKPVRAFVEAIAHAIRTLGYSVIVLDKAHHGSTPDTFMEVENAHDFVLHVAEKHEAHWRILSARQVDHAFWIADPLTHPDTHQINEERQVSPRAGDLILLYDDKTPTAAIEGRSREWIDATSAARWFHIHEQAAEDVARIARIVTGHSVGVVFSGGGARAFAQIGAIQALRDFKVPVDFVCGSSMGAILGATMALKWSQEEIDRRIRDAFVSSSPLDDITFPFVAMTGGKKVDERLKKHFDDIRIEDMPLPFFCVSSNLTNGQIKTHRTGLLRNALRASISLPGVMPPFVDEGQVLVDGAVMKSFPAGMMRNTHLGTVIGIDVTRARGLDPVSVKSPSNLPGWISGGDWRRGPPIVSILMRSATITTTADLAQARAATDLLVIPEPDGVEIRDWHAYDEAVEVGYRTTVDTLAQLDCPVTQLRKLGRSVHPNIPAFTPDDYDATVQVPKRKPKIAKGVSTHPPENTGEEEA